ncbi:RNA polymerase Rpc34, partial [Blastocladiella britannica]
RLVTAATAAKLGELDAEERMVYEAVKAAASEGILQVTLRSRVPVAENVIVKSLKKLEGRGLIKQVKSVKYGNKKMFMLSELQPSVELTGGVWFTNQELDVTFVEHMSAAVLRFVGKNVRSFLCHSAYPTDGSMSIYPTAFSDHPTLPQIAKFLRTSQAAKVDLSVSDIGLLLDMLVYDGKLERIPMPAVTLSMGGDASMDVDYNDDMDLDADDADNGGDLGEQWMYRLVRERVGTTGLGTMPCGVCPVMRDCGQPGSAVDPVSCDYMKRWLD